MEKLYCITQPRCLRSGLGVELTAHMRKDSSSIPMLDQKLFTKCWMGVVGQLHKYIGAEAYYYIMIDTPNDTPSDLK